MTEATGGAGSAAQDPQVNPDPPADDVEERPALQVTRRNIVVLGGFLLASLAALYFLLPQLAGLDDTWNRIGDGRPAWTAAALLLTFGMFGGYVAMFRGVFVARRLAHRLGGELPDHDGRARRLAVVRGRRRGRAGADRVGAEALRDAQAHGRGQDDLVPRAHVPALRDRGGGVRLRPALGALQRRGPVLAHVRAGRRRGRAARARAGDRVRPDRPAAAHAPDRRARGAGSAAWPSSSPRCPAATSAGVRDALEHLRSRDPALLGAVLFWAFQIAVLWAAFHAFGDAPPIAVLVQAFFVGMLGNLLPMPGGVGGVEGGMIGAFAAFGVDSGLAVVAVLVYRAFTFWLPLLPGVFAYFRLRRTVDGWKQERTASATA